MMRKELLVSGGMATILTVVTGVVLYFHGAGDPTTDIPAADTVEADQPKTEPSVPGWPAATASNNTAAASNSAAAADANAVVPGTSPNAAPRNPFPDVAAGSSPWSKPAADAKAHADEVAKDAPKPFGANEAADAASAFSNRFKSDVAAIEKKIDEALPTTGPELKAPSEAVNPLRNPTASAPANTPASTPAAPPFGASPATAEPRAPVATSPATPANTSPFGGSPFGSSQPAPAATIAAPPAANTAAAPANDVAPNNVATATPPMRAPTSEDLQWRPQGTAGSPQRVTSDLTDNPLRSSASASPPMSDVATKGPVPPSSSLAGNTVPQTMTSATTTLPTLPRRDAPAARPDLSPQTRPAETATPRQPVQVASTIPVSTPPRVVPIPAGTRTQELGRVYIVEEGDSLSDIARRELGNSARAGEIQALNREVLGSTAFLRPGLELILPR